MNWLEVIRAGRQHLIQKASADDEASLKVEVFEKDEGKEKGLESLEAAALAAVLHTTTEHMYILSMGSAIPATGTNHWQRQNLVEVLEETETGLRARGEFSALLLSAKDAAARMQESQWLDAVAARNRDTIVALRTKLHGNQRTKLKELHKKQEMIASLKDQIQELARKRDVRILYVERSLASQREQIRMRNEDLENVLRTQLQTISGKTDNESNVHHHFVTFLNHSIKDLQEKIQKWTEFYDDEMNRRLIKLKMVREKIREERAKLDDLVKLFEEHQREINEYLEYKKQKRLEAEHDQFLYDTATKIQAWWRGTMVRRGLGPYKKRKKPPKDKKKKK